MRRQLCVRTAVVTSLVLLIAAVCLNTLIHRSLRKEFDAKLASKVRSLATRVEQANGEIKHGFAGVRIPEFARKARPEYFQLWNEDGEVLARSWRLADDQTLPQQGVGSLNHPAVQPATLPDGRQGLVATARFIPEFVDEFARPLGPKEDESDDAPDSLTRRLRVSATLSVAVETTELTASIRRLRYLMIGVLASTLVGSLLGLWWVVTRSMQPFQRMAQRIAEIDDQSLDERFDVDSLPLEVRPVLIRLNELFGRLQVAFSRERTFSADVAHELRTPLAGLRATLEVSLKRRRDAASMRESMEDCLAICADTERTVETLLSLARIESGGEELETEQTDFPSLVRRCWQPFERRASSREVVVSWKGAEGIIFMTDAAKLEVVVSNLFDNATCYVNNAGHIAITYFAGIDRVLLRVENSGCTLTESDRAQVFERFWRADHARTDVGTHAGLGLALCHKIVEHLGGTIDLQISGGVFRIELQLPRVANSTMIQETLSFDTAAHPAGNDVGSRS